MLAVIDLETGGLNSKTDAIVSVACVIVDESFNEIERHYAIVKDALDKIISDTALAVNGITRDQIEKGLPCDKVLDKLKEIIEGKKIVCHNAAFDMGFLNNRGFNVLEAIDTMNLSWVKWPSAKAKLGLVVERFGIPIENAHNSLGDVLMTIKILKEFSKDENLHALEPKPIDFDRFKRR